MNDVREVGRDREAISLSYVIAHLKELEDNNCNLRRDAGWRTQKSNFFRLVEGVSPGILSFEEEIEVMEDHPDCGDDLSEGLRGTYGELLDYAAQLQ